MRRSLLLLTLALGLASSAAVPRSADAQEYGSTYDWRSGNSYHWNRNYDGSTTIRGMNIQNGTMWNNTIQPNGDQRGFDSRGNFWRYNEATGSYWNSDGHGCIGKGYGRTCW